MATQFFDGREFAQGKEEELKKNVWFLKDKGIVPALVSIIVGDDPASVLYVNLKKKAAEKIGCRLLVVGFSEKINKTIIAERIIELNNDKNVHGIMIQLPLPDNFSREERDNILNTITPNKDVDGLREDSSFATPTAMATMEALKQGLNNVQPTLGDGSRKLAVVGASGFEGRKIVEAIKKETKLMDTEIVELNSRTENLKSEIQNSQIVISVTGVPNLIKAEFVKQGSVLIDVGSPKGDIEKEAYNKASFVSPVPGGVGPVTISCLLENLINSASKKLS